MYALIDCNNFYCSCEKVFNPALEGRPVVVLSNNDGCVISRSDEAKVLGVRMGTPAFTSEDFFQKNKVVVYSSNYTLYGDFSDRVMKTLAAFVPGLEVYSIDEAFLALHDLRCLDLLELAIRISDTVKKNTGIPVTLGIAATKTLAKMANRFAKRKRKAHGCFWAANHELVNEMLECTGVADVWGIGPQHAKWLIKHGFTNALQLLRAPEEWIRVNLSVVGQRLLNELKGIPAIEWEFEKPDKQNICTARGFGQLLKTKHEVREALASYAALCAVKLREQKSCTSKIDVFVETNAFRREDQQYRRSVCLSLPVSTNNTPQLIKYAMKALDIVYKDGLNYHKAGITVMDLVPDDQVQFGFYDAAETEREKALLQTMDRLNKSFGRDRLRFAQQGYGKKWKLKQTKLSPCFTTRIGDILKVKN